MKFFSVSLSRKAFLSIVIILLPIIVSFFIAYLSNKRELERLISDEITMMAEAYEGQVYQFLEMSKRRVQDFSSDGFIRDQLKRIINGDEGAVHALNDHLIGNKMPLDKYIHAIHVLSLKDGHVVASTDSAAIGKDVANELFFKDGKDGLSVVENSTGFEGRPGISISAPLKDRVTGNLFGIIVNFISLAELNNVLTGELNKRAGAITWNKGMSRALEVYIVNKNGLMITDSGFTKGAVLRQKVNTPPVAACLQSNKEMTGIYENYRGMKVIGASMCLPSLKWTLMVEDELDDVFAPVVMLERSALAVLGIVTVLVASLYGVFSRNVVAPLAKLTGAANEIARGNYDVSVQVQTADEIGSLSKAFNDMALDIRATTNMLKAGTMALEASESRLANAQRIARLGNWDWDIVKNELYWSDEIYRILGVAPQEFGATYETFLSYVHPDDRDLVKKSVEEALNERKPYSIDHRIVLGDGSERIVHERADVVFDEAGRSIRMVGTVQDVTEHKKADFELKKLSMAIEQSVNMIFITDFKGEIEYVNPMFEEVTGWSEEEAIGRNPGILASGDTTKEEYREMWETITSGKTWRGAFKNKKKDGRVYWVRAVITPIRNERGEITHFLAVQEDITERIKSEERIQYLAFYDELTGLINRSRFMELQSQWMDTQGDAKRGALLLIDIDEFKFINDSYGHGIGDELLRRMAGFLRNAVKEMGMRYTKNSNGILSGRMGGDEFAVFLPDLNTKEGVEVAERIKESLETFHPLETPIHFTASIGIVAYPEHGTTVKELFTKADAAMYRAKEMGRNRIHLYRPEDRDLESIHSRLKEKVRIKKALEEDRFIPWFQPILCLNDDKVNHYEALARMRDEDDTILLPGAFIDTAERFGLIGAIDRVVMEKTMRLQADMARQGRYLSFGMNLSGKNLGDEGLLSFLQSKISETGADPSRLTFEITETATVHDLDRAIKFINALKSLGCRFSLDDFGVGFTSFVYLREMQVDYIKIDGSFIKRLNENPHDQLFVKAITEVARGMGIKTIAEFVEKEESLKLLREYEVDYAQGYLIGKPGPELSAG